MSGTDEGDAQLGATIPTTQRSVSGSLDDAEARNRLEAGASVGRYRLVSRLGAGAMGEVWAATDPQLERRIAIKLVHPRLAADPDTSARMVREARAMAKVSHRAVIAIHDAGEADGRLFLAMELVVGRTLGALLAERGTREPGEWRRRTAIMIEAGRGLAAAHAAGVLHRDFKPDNVMVDERGRARVGDFGLASLGGGPRSKPSRPSSLQRTEVDLTMTGALLGTPAYMSLEQLEGATVDARSDQFSFCVATYEALYGERPFVLESGSHSSIVMLAEAVAAGAVRPAPAQSDVPSSVRAIIVRGLAPNPNDRWPDLESLLVALAHELVPRPAWQSRRMIAALFFAIAVVAGGIAFVVRRGSRAPVAPSRVEATAHPISPMPLRAAFAVSSNGRIAIGTDRIEVREVPSGRTWAVTPTTSSRAWIDELQFIGDDLLQWSDEADPGVVWRWASAAGAPPVRTTDARGGHWIGSVREGELVATADTIELRAGDQTRATWPHVADKLDLLVIAPSGHRFAYLASDRFAGRIVAIDSATGKRWESSKLIEPSGLGWRTDDTLIYATADGAIYEIGLGAAGFGTARRVYQLAAGWAGRILVSPEHVRFVSHAPVTRVRVIDREPASVRDFEPSVAAGVLGWLPDGAFVVWNRSTHVLERRGENGPSVRLDVELPSEPANASFAGDLLIAALREHGGRRLVAVSLTTGAIAWEHPIGTSLMARCARDLVEPCFVGRRTAELGEKYEVLALDPHTGKTSGAPIYDGPLEDFAVRADGQRVLVADGLTLRELDLAGTCTETFGLEVSTVRSVAYDPRGGVIVAGTIFGNSYAVMRQIGTGSVMLARSDGELLSMVRPSPLTGQIVTLGRSLVSELWELELPP